MNDKQANIIWWLMLIGTLAALVLGSLYAPVSPPKCMKSSDPYWYSGE